MSSDNLSSRSIHGHTVRIREARTEPPLATVLMLHGLSGDENVMWIFGNRVPREFRVIALRGLYTTPRGGFSWVPRDKQGRARLEDFEPALEALMTLIAAYPDLPSGGMDSVHVMGFSQGAALAYVAALRQPHRLRSVAGLAGFLPAGSDTLAEKPELRGLPFFIAHGTRDTTVPIAAAYHAVNFFRNLEAAVTFCEANTGHKLDADCARALAHFYRDLKGKQGE